MKISEWTKKTWSPVDVKLEARQFQSNVFIFIVVRRRFERFKQRFRLFQFLVCDTNEKLLSDDFINFKVART